MRRFANFRADSGELTGGAFRAFPAGFDPRGRRNPDLFPGALLLPEESRTHWIVANVFAGMYGAAMVPDLLTLARDWPPDLIVRDAPEYGGCIAAEALGIPHASVRTAAVGSTSRTSFRSRRARERMGAS